jgi:hypothetical protein
LLRRQPGLTQLGAPGGRPAGADVLGQVVALVEKWRRPSTTVVLFTEAKPTPREPQDFAGIVQDLIRAAPELTLGVRVTVIAEGAKPAPDVIAALNDLLAGAGRKLQLE